MDKTSITFLGIGSGLTAGVLIYFMWKYKQSLGVHNQQPNAELAAIVDTALESYGEIVPYLGGISYGVKEGDISLEGKTFPYYQGASNPNFETTKVYHNYTQRWAAFYYMEGWKVVVY